MLFRGQRTVAALGAALIVVGCVDAPTATSVRPGALLSGVSSSKNYVVLVNGSGIPTGFAASMAAAGGTVSRTIPAIGMAVVSSDNPNFAAAAAGVRGVSDVAEDLAIQWQKPMTTVVEDLTDLSVGAQASYGSGESFRSLQWAPDAVNAPAAWNAGYLGRGARVAVLDGGIYSAHIDIASNLDVGSSRSFVPGVPFNADVGTFWHGTHVAGIIAAPGQNIGTVGIAPAATIIGVKVLHNGSGDFSWVIDGIIYASTPIAMGGAGANIINMSLGAEFDRQGRDAAHLAVALGRATMYARQQGTLVIASAGNSALDLDHTNNLVSLPAQAPGVVSVSALGPMGWAVSGNAFNLDRPASYTNFGQSAITFGGPGGDFVLPGNANCTKPLNPSGSITRPCWVFDMVMAPCRGSGLSISTYCWAAGTSMAAPAVAGVAALIVGKYGPLQPAQLEARLRSSSDDLGKPGKDDFYGSGRVNAGRAVQ